MNDVFWMDVLNLTGGLFGFSGGWDVEGTNVVGVLLFKLLLFSLASVNFAFVIARHT